MFDLCRSLHRLHAQGGSFTQCADLEKHSPTESHPASAFCFSVSNKEQELECFPELGIQRADIRKGQRCRYQLLSKPFFLLGFVCVCCGMRERKTCSCVCVDIKGGCQMCCSVPSLLFPEEALPLNLELGKQSAGHSNPPVSVPLPVCWTNSLYGQARLFRVYWGFDHRSSCLHGNRLCMLSHLPSFPKLYFLNETEPYPGECVIGHLCPSAPYFPILPLCLVGTPTSGKPI